MTDNNTYSYKQIRSLSDKLYRYILEPTVESVSHQFWNSRNRTPSQLFLRHIAYVFDIDIQVLKSDIELVINKTNYPGRYNIMLVPLEDTCLYIRRCLERVKGDIDSILSLLFVFGYRFSPTDLGKLWKKFFLLDSVNEFEAYMKFQSSSYLAKMLDQDIHAGMPESRDYSPEFFLVGGMNKFLRARLFTRDLHFGWSVCQLKRGMAPLRGISVIQNLRKHKALLSNRRTTPPELLWEVSRTTRELFESADPELTFKVQRPSPAACYEFSRVKQGCIKSICDRQHDGYERQSFGLLSLPHTITEVVDGMETEVRIERPLFHEPDFVFEGDPFMMWARDELPYESQSVEPRLEVFTEIDSRQVFTDVENRLHANVNAIPATVVALSEPFKTRIITKSMADANYYAKPLQQAMHRTLRNNSIFVALDRPLVLEDFVDMCKTKDENPDWLFVSGDYSAATDNLNSDATLSSLFEVMEKFRIQSKTRVVLAKAVANQEINYSGSLSNYSEDPDIQILLRYGVTWTGELDGEVPSTFVQTNGQLMGSILSFPLLCMINAAVFRHAAEIYFTEVLEKETTLSMSLCESIFGLKINGDDILFIAPKRLIDIWSSIVSNIGLDLSIGKNYVHPTIFTINSQMFQYHSFGMVQEHNYLNLGLLTPDPDQFSFFRTCDRVQQRLYRGFVGEKVERLHDVLMYNWSPSLLKLQTTLSCNLNWYFPRHLGGLGLQTFSPVVSSIRQRRIATTLMTRNRIEDILRNKLIISERVIDPVLKKQLGDYKRIVKTIGYELKDNEPDDDLMVKLMDRYVVDYVPYKPDAPERSLVIEMVRDLRRIDRDCGSLEPACVEKILFHTPSSVCLKSHTFELTEYLTSYPVCRYDMIDDTTDEFSMECLRNPAILSEEVCYWTALGYSRSSDDGKLYHL